MDKFWEKVRVTSSSKCWEWNAYINKLGYGRFMYQGKVRQAHRIAWTLTYGNIEEGLSVLHRCDNRRCVNPSHLFLGTQADNVRDALGKGRMRFNPRRGESVVTSKLTSKDVLAMRVMREQGLTLLDIAKRYGVSFQHASRIVNRKVWKHV